MNLRATLSWGPKHGGWALLWLSNPKSWRVGEWQLRSGFYPPADQPETRRMSATTLPPLWRFWRVGPLELRSHLK